MKRKKKTQQSERVKAMKEENHYYQKITGKTRCDRLHHLGYCQSCSGVRTDVNGVPTLFDTYLNGRCIFQFYDFPHFFLALHP